ncbi:nucleotidyltransferase family protein [Sporosarcina sp. E16_3]|uniref:nucleotidyltransferase domain-containing protein n=1 Tax=Sporosarcina sp. E16_3 TaxID=2789293 RepID=UPI001A93396E|nr:nucleotidyltransferase family protein [Sporosarcina sp. E16_3]MBO0602534.1 nucleotidyltransferase family protein [Sporosarcina sp. E16_3]
MDNNNDLDLSFMPKELKLLLQIMQTENPGYQGCLNKELFAEIDWELFLKLARHHRIYPLIYSNLSKMDEKLIPSHVLHTLSQEYKENTFQMLNLSGEMERISQLFNENGIRSLFLKGPVIADAIFGDISLRTSKDLDILVPKLDVNKTEALLLSCGYEREETRSPFKMDKWRSHHVCYYHSQKRIQIEIHWRLYTPPAKEPSFDELWERKRLSTLTSYPVYFFGEEDLFLFLVGHGAKHGWFRLRWLADIDQIIRNGKFPLLIKHQRHLVGQALLLASQLLKTQIPEVFVPFTVEKRSRKLAELATYYLVEMGYVSINQSSKEPLINHDKLHPLLSKPKFKRWFTLFYYNYSVKTNIQKVIYVLLHFYPQSADVQTLRLPKPLYFLYFPLRPFFVVWRKSSKLTLTVKRIQKAENK